MPEELPPTPSPEPTPPTPEPPKTPDPAPAPAALTAENIKLGEGFEADPGLMGDFLGIMNDSALSAGDRAQKLVDLQTQFTKASAEKAIAQWEGLQEQWQTEARNDPEIGGEKLEPLLGQISTLINVHGSPELRQIMDQTGAGNNVHVIKFLGKIATALGESAPAPAAVPTGGAKTLAQRMYPDMK